MDNLMKVENLKTIFKTEDGIVNAVNGISFNLNTGEVLGIVGESGCGKSIACLSMLKLIPQPPGLIESGKVYFGGKDLLSLSEKDIRKVRGKDISMVFQNPMTSLNPLLTIGRQLSEMIELHLDMKSNKEKKMKTIELLKEVGIPDAEKIIYEYPHRLSGGMRQRVMIAMALACNPKLLIADEPTTALDVTIQAQIMDILKELRKLDISIILITHDLAVISEMTERVIVMYAGNIVEEAKVKTIFSNPSHPYTKGLINSTPRVEQEKADIRPIRGSVPDPLSMPQGCAFNPRCDFTEDVCRKKTPPIIEVAPDHKVACWLYSEKGEA